MTRGGGSKRERVTVLFMTHHGRGSWRRWRDGVRGATTLTRAPGLTVTVALV